MLLKALVEAYIEHWRTRKALRLLTKQEWSVDFLTVLLVRAARLTKSHLQMRITNGTQALEISTVEKAADIEKDDNIFDHLDDDIRVNAFINEVNK